MNVGIVGLMFSILAVGSANADVVNGSFEVPATGDANIIEVSPGNEPAGFTWRVNSGTVEIIHQGYTDPASQVFAGPAFDSAQYLDLDGISPGSISQTISTTPGGEYALVFEYANNPFRNGASDTGNPSMAVRVVDAATNAGLASATFSHNTSTGTDFDWTPSDSIDFFATGSTTVVEFDSGDAPGSDEGIFLDAISVMPVPEPGFPLIVLGLLAAGCRNWSRPPAACSRNQRRCRAPREYLNRARTFVSSGRATDCPPFRAPSR